MDNDEVKNATVELTPDEVKLISTHTSNFGTATFNLYMTRERLS